MVSRRMVRSTSAALATLFTVALATASRADAATFADFAGLPSGPGSNGTRSGSALHAQLEHERAREGEPVRLVLRQSGGTGAPDLSPLEADFEILGTQQSQRFEVVNGRAASSHDWIVTLLPRRKGTIEIPAIRAGDATSAPLQLVVSDAPPPPGRGDTPDLFVEAEVDQTQPYVQGELRYTARVFDGIGMLEGSLTEPTAADLRITPLGEAKTYETTVNGRPYRVHEREYAMSPQKSGEVEIPALTLEARLPERRGRGHDRLSGSPFDEMFEDLDAGFPGGGFASPFFDRFLARGEVVRVRSNPISLAVQARPGDAQTGWVLPARKVELDESFSPANPTFRVGEAVQRTVALRALGAASEQLPRFEIPGVDGVRVYDEGSRDGSAPSPDGTISILERTVGIVPTKSGALELPAIQVERFDVDAKEKRVAMLPARTIDVRPAIGEAPAEAAAPAPHEAPAAGSTQKRIAPAAPQAEAATTGPSPEAVAAHPTPTPWSPWLVAGIAALTFAAGLGAAWTIRRRSQPVSLPADGASGTAATGTKRQLAREVRSACDRGDARAAREALIRWARLAWPGTGNRAIPPQEIARRLGSAQLGSALTELDRAIYAPAGAEWRGAELWQAFRAASHAEEPANDRVDGLRPLYPEPART
jgi:hypothetical protein